MKNEVKKFFETIASYDEKIIKLKGELEGLEKELDINAPAFSNSTVSEFNQLVAKRKADATKANELIKKMEKQRDNICAKAYKDELFCMRIGDLQKEGIEFNDVKLIWRSNWGDTNIHGGYDKYGFCVLSAYHIKHFIETMNNKISRDECSNMFCDDLAIHTDYGAFAPETNKSKSNGIDIFSILSVIGNSPWQSGLALNKDMIPNIYLNFNPKEIMVLKSSTKEQECNLFKAIVNCCLEKAPIQNQINTDYEINKK